MFSLAKEEALAHQWHITGIYQGRFIVALMIIVAIIGFISAYLITSYLITSVHFDWSKYDSVIVGILSAFCCGCIVILYLGWCSNGATGATGATGAMVGNLQSSSLSPTTVAKQNIKIIKDKRKLPKLEHLDNHYNNQYMYYTHHEDDNLEKPLTSLHYEHLFFKTKNKIKNIKSLMSYRDSRQQAKTKHGGIHYIRKPRKSDIFMPRRYSFKMSKYEHTLSEYGVN